MHKIRTPRLHLRPATISDAFFFARLIDCPHVRRFLGGPVPHAKKLSTIRGYIWPTQGDLTWTVLADKRKIGVMFLSRHKDGLDHELSYMFHPSAWGKGFATEASHGVCGYARETLKYSSLIAETQTANIASCNVLKAIGMKQHQQLDRFGASQSIYRLDWTTYP